MNLFAAYNIVIYMKYINLVIQRTQIHFSDTFGLHPQFLAHSSHAPWDFLSNERSNGISGYVHANHVVRGLKLYLTSCYLERREGLEVESVPSGQ